MNEATLVDEAVGAQDSGGLPGKSSEIDTLQNTLSRRIKLFKRSLSQFDIRLWRDPLMLVSVVLLGMMSAFSILPEGTLSDEGFHWHQMLEYFAGRFDTVPSLTMYPGYHRAVYALSELFSLHTMAEVRYVCFALAIPALAFFFLIVRHYDRENCHPISLQLFLSPIVFPFFFLLYTDVPSLALIMASVWLITVRKNYQIAALVMGASLFFRQTNIVWLVMLWTISLANMGFFSAALDDFSTFVRKWPHYLRETWLFSVFCILFAIFLYINKGVAIGDAGSHQLGFHPTQLFALLFVLFFLFIPLHISNFRKIVSLVKSDPLIPFAGMLLFAFYIFSYDTNHGYNVPQLDWFLKNNFLELIRNNFFAKALAFIPIVIAFFSLLVTPLRRKEHYWIYLFMALSLLPVYLIDLRYFFVSIALFMLFRQPMSRRMEYLQATIYVPFTVYIFEGISQYRFFI